MRRASRHIKLDAHHVATVRELEKQGVECLTIHEPVDLLLRLEGYMSLCELKVEGSDGNFQRSQIAFMASTKMPVFVARNAAEALDKLRRRETIGKAVKDALAAVLLKSDAKSFRPGPIHRILESK